MDNNITLQSVKDKVREFCEVRDWDQFHAPQHLAVGVVTEAAELLDLFRFQNDEQAQKTLETKRGLVEEEVADVLFFLARFAQLHNIDLSAAFEKKLVKNGEKYPVEKSKGSNKKYHEL